MARLNIIPVSGFCPAYPDDLSQGPIDLPVASGFATDIYPGDPVIGVTDGTVARTPAGSAAGAATDGITFIVLDVIQYRDPAGFVRRNGARFLPAGTTYTADSDRSMLSLLPVTADMVFRVRVNAGNASIAVARATGFANADHVYTGADTGLGLSGARLNLATLNVTPTLQWRIVKWEDNAVSNDPTQADYRCLVVPNLPFAWPIVGHSLTGI
jgi:hypothetical protein